jgi:hypothetical protein
MIRFIQALRDQWDKLIALASKNGVGFLVASFWLLLTQSCLQVDLGLLYRQVTECGMSCIDESRCRYAMLFYRCSILHENTLLHNFVVTSSFQAIFMSQSSNVLFQKLVRSGP